MGTNVKRQGEEQKILNKKMGNDTSKPHHDHEQADRQHLRDRFPFGEDELGRLYDQAYCKVKWPHNGSFLSELHRNGPVDEEGVRRRLATVEQDILPRHFGNRLELVAFLRPADRDKETSSQIEKQDEHVRLARMEAFFDGLANCSGNRGGRAALGTMFEVCVQGSHPTSSNDLVDCNGNEIKAKVMLVLDLAYRLALATEFLRGGGSDNKDQHALLPEDNSAQSHALQSMTSSCLDFVRRQRMRRSVAVEDFDDEDLEQGYCSKMDFLEWSQETLPSLSLVLPTFHHALLFPGDPFPPTLSAFLFPRLNDESAFLGEGNSTALFSFACMSKSLGGAVSAFCF